MNRLLFLASLLLVFSAGAFAQMLPPDIGMPEHVHSAANVPVIDGAKNPELIPDTTAYRLFFVSLAEGANPAPEETVGHKSHLARVQLNDLDGQGLADTLRNFKERYDALIKSYNALADALIQKGEAPDYNAFLSKREALVQATRDELKAALSVEGLSKLDVFVQAEKRKMRIQPAQ